MVNVALLNSTSFPAKKNEFAFFQTQSGLFGPAQYVNAGDFSWRWILLFKFKKRKENSSSYVHVLHKTKI